MDTLAKIYLIAVAFASVITFVAFGWDKRRAVVGGGRVPEKILHMLALFGGWPGALLGQQFFRHKTIKFSFRLLLWFVVVLHLALIAGWIYFRWS